MSALRPMLVALALGSAMISRPAEAQNASVSLTHLLTVTVPPRVRVQMAPVASVVQTGTNVVRGPASLNGLALTVSATQAWSLSIESASKSNVQWSLDNRSGFARVTKQAAAVASGTISQVPSGATLFFRDSAASSRTSDNEGAAPEAIVLTVTAQ
ncbi:MAG: hypothetical protein ABI469_06595 [Gemmatimonadales bacterium]